MIPEKAKLRREISALLLQAGHQDAAEDAAYGKNLRGDELPAALSSPEESARQELNCHTSGEFKTKLCQFRCTGVA